MSLLQSIIPLVARFSRNERYQIPVEGHMRHPPIGGGGKQSGWDSIIASRLVIDRFQDAGRNGSRRRPLEQKLHGAQVNIYGGQQIRRG